MKKALLTVFVAMLHFGALKAQIFSQNFNGSTVLSSYFSNSPNASQFTATANNSNITPSITNGQLRIVKNGVASTYLYRNLFPTNTTPPTFIQLKFDFTVSNQALATPTVVMPLYFGPSFTTSPTSLTDFHCRLGIGISETPGNFYLKIMENGSTQSADFSGKQTITVVVNNSGDTKFYIGPNNNLESISNDDWEVWVGNTRVFNEVPARNTNLNIGAFKFQYNSTFPNATLDFDNFEMKELSNDLPSPNLPNTNNTDLSLAHPYIWATYAERQAIVDNINQFEWAKSAYYQFKSRVDGIKNAHKLNPQTYLSTIPALLPGVIGDRATHTERLAIASESAILYYLTYDNDYAQLASDILSHYTDRLALADTVNIRKGYFFNDWWLESRAAYPKIGIIYDFVYHYINNPANKVYDLATTSYKTFNNTAAQATVQKLAANVLKSVTAPRSNHSVLAGNGALVNLLMIDDDNKREAFFNRFYVDPQNHPFDSYLFTLNRFSVQNIWPETISYSRDVHEIILQSLNIIDRIKPQLNIINNNIRILEGSYKYANFFFPTRASIRYGDSHRNIDKIKVYQRLLTIATRKNLTNFINKTREHLQSEYILSGGYEPEITTETLEWYNPLTILWGVNIPSNTPSTPLPIEPTVRIEHAGTIVQRNYQTPNIVNNGLMYTSGGASYVHAHATGIDMEIYGNGIIHGVDNGTTDYDSDQHDNYEVRHAAHNCVIVNASAKRGTTTVWDHIMNRVTLTASEPKPDFQPISSNFSFSTQTLKDTLNDALQQRTISIIRTSETSGYYLDIFRSKANGINNYHDYLYHNIGDTLVLRNAADNSLLATSASNKYTVDISGSVSGWKFFKNVMSSGGVLGGVKSVVSLNTVGKYMNIFTPSGVSREYASAIAPETDGAEHGYGTKPTRVLTMRQYGEAWNKPFVNAFEPTTSTTSTIQSIEHIVNGSKNVGAKVVSIVNGETITDYIISHEDNTSTYTDAALNFSFTGRFGILRLIQKNNVTQSNLYIGEGVSMTYQNRSLNANSDDNGFLNAESLPVQLVHFNAKANSNNVQLTWETALEINSKNFTVYHSTDGIHFNEIAQIPSKNQPSTYQFTHTNPSNKTNYYKLIQADNDGRKSDLGLRLVNFQSGNQKTISIYPNPVQGVVNINYYSNAADKLLVQIFDITGKVIQETTIPVFQDKNQYSLPLNKQIIAGMYLMKITSKNTSFSERLLVK